MKLAMSTSAGVAHCLLCCWQYKMAEKRRIRRTQEEIILTTLERSQALEKAVLAHLRDVHDRMMLTKEELVDKDNKEGLPKAYYYGRRPERGL